MDEYLATRSLNRMLLEEYLDPDIVREIEQLINDTIDKRLAKIHEDLTHLRAHLNLPPV